MPPEVRTQPTIGVLLERIDHLRQELRDVGTMLADHVESQNVFLTAYTKAHAELEYKANHALERVDKTDKNVESLAAKMNELAAKMAPLITTNKILSGLAFMLVPLVVAMIWGILTHQITLVFPP